MRWKSLEFPVASSSMWGPYSIWNLILTFLLMTNLTSARAIRGPDWNCQRDPSCETWQWLRAHLPALCQVLKPSNPQSIRKSNNSLPDPMWTEQRESPCTSGLWCGFRFNSVKTDNKQLQSRCPSPVPTFFEDANLLLYSPMSQEDVRWNWEKASSTKFPIYVDIFALSRRYMCKTRFNGKLHQALRNRWGKNHLHQPCSSSWKW